MSTAYGVLRGVVRDGVHVFLGIPYAAPPDGADRLRPPRPPTAWDGVRDATRPGPEPPQVAPPATGGPPAGADESWQDVGAAFEAVHRAPPSSDYLDLNIWTPDPGRAGLPVMVWIQGGMFELSSTEAYDGRAFARDGVVCVVINWRPGAEGFLYLDDGVADVGLLDQVAALVWVRDNITSFGGDPGNVTVFGESAGAMSIGCLLAMPEARGLFRRAVLQSGAAHHTLSPQHALLVGQDLARRMGVPPTRDAVAGEGVARLLAAQAEQKADLLAHPDPDRWGLPLVASMMPWQPVADGTVLPVPPIDGVRAGCARDVDVLVGTNTDDWRLWLVVSGAFPGISDEVLLGDVRTHGYQSVHAYGLDAAALDAYRRRYPRAVPGDLLAAVQTDWWMRIPAIRLADAHADAQAHADHAATASTYMYEFAWAAPGLGAVHALEVPFVFDTARSDAPLFGPLLGADPPQELARTMHSAWVAFASTGDPGWPAYDTDHRSTRLIDSTCSVLDDPRAWERALWDGLR